MEYTLFKNLKRRRSYIDLDEEFRQGKRSKFNDENIEEDYVRCVIAATTAIENKKPRKPRSRNRNRAIGKLWWNDVYTNWSDEDFKEKMRIQRETFNQILFTIRDQIELQPTNINPFPTSPDRQLALTIYRLSTGCSFAIISDVFGVSVSSASIFFNKVCRVIVAKLYDTYVTLPITDEDWEIEIRGFLENYEFPCVGAFDGFHVHISSKLKSYYSFKKKYTVNNLGLVSYNKRFLYAAVGAPGSTHDARLLKSASIYSDIINGSVIPDRKVALGNFGDIPLVTIGDSAFPRFSWLIKSYNENTSDKQQRYFNKRLCGARVVTENAYGMLKGRWRILFKQTECRLFNLRYITMACIALHNLCISVSDPCKPRWKLKVKDLGLMKKHLIRNENTKESNLNRMKISNWLWMDH